MSPAAVTPEQFTTFGELLKYLRRQARITQRELAIAVGYSDTQISRMEQNQRVPDSTTVAALFVPALYIEKESQWVARLIELTKSAHGNEAVETDHPSGPNNLPIQLTSFIGREKEITEVGDLIQNHRLVTLTGSGGTGKTRLSLQTASELFTTFPDGVWLIEFAPISDPALVPYTLANLFGLRESGGTKSSIVELLIEYFGFRKALLIFDNCEHLIEATARLAESLLQACKNIHILASSREALGVKGELAYRVPSLNIPEESSDISSLMKSESARLFVERALDSFPDFSLTPSNASTIAQICSRLDGIPLALELAAARVKMMTVDEIAKRLDDRFRLLTGGARTALPRQQTLRAMIDWSYNLLSEQEKTLFRRLAVFVGGWTLEAAESVCSREGIETDEILDLMSQLVNKSLVIVEGIEDESRYHRLETIRQYAREKLLDSGEVESVRKKHSEWFLTAASRSEMEYLNAQNEISLLNRFEDDHENFRAALDWLLATEQFENYAQLASALGMFWFELGHYQEGRHRLDAGFIHREGLSKIVIARILRVLCRILARMGNYELAITYGEESVTLFRELDNKTELAWAVDSLSDTFSENGDDKEADIYYQEALTLYREVGNKSGIAYMMIEVGWGQVVAGNFEEGFTNLEESLKLLRNLDEAYGIAYAMFVIGTCRWHSHEYEKSEIAAKEGIKLFHQLGNKWFANGCLAVLAGVSSARGQPQQAAKYIGVTDKVLEAIRGSIPPFWARDVVNPILASIHAQLNDVDYDKAYHEGYSMTLDQALKFTLDVANE